MKTSFNLGRFWALLFICVLIGYASSLGQSMPLTGAWQFTNEDNEEVLLFQNGYFTHTVYSLKNKKFISSRGGIYKTQNKGFTVNMEFNSADKDEVGKSLTYSFSVNNNILSTDVNGKQEKWKRLDNSSAPLAGVWRITERMQDGKLVPIHQSGARKTLKILTGTRFQWAAINPETKEFSGTGGGTYTFSNGKYTEAIEFFSRDDSRVGAKLEFDGKLENGKWHHSGLSSKGDKIYEVWSRVKYD